jgi:sphinganine-1-phosphate aldolase
MPTVLLRPEVLFNLFKNFLGSESILMGMLANKNFYSEKKNIKKPNMYLELIKIFRVICDTAHPAFFKACNYYNIEVILIKSNKDKTVDVSKLRKSINKNTVCVIFYIFTYNKIVGSCPSFPHGCIDNIPELGKIALKYDVGLHVDACLGSFIVPFARDLGMEIPDFDFRVPGK